MTARRYDLIGDLSDHDVTLTRRLLANDTIEISTEGELPAEFAGAAEADVRVDTVPLAALADEELLRLSQDRVLSLDLTEMPTIQAHFIAEGRPRPTLGSTLRPDGPSTVWPSSGQVSSPRRPTAPSPSHHDGLLPATRVTEELDPPVRSAFVDDAGIVAFDDEYDVAFKVETHNHPSALEPSVAQHRGGRRYSRRDRCVRSPDRLHRCALLWAC